MVDIYREEYVWLKALIGVDLKILKEDVFTKHMNVKTNGFNKIIGGVAEDAIAFMIGVDGVVARPGTTKGADFGDLGEVKSVKSHHIKKAQLTKQQKKNLKDLGINIDDTSNTNLYTKLRHQGDIPICEFERNVDFIKSNLWSKLKICIFVYHINYIIVDIRIFDGEKFFEVLKNDIKFINNNENDKTKILTIKNFISKKLIARFGDSTNMLYDLGALDIDNYFENKLYFDNYVKEYSNDSCVICEIKRNGIGTGEYGLHSKTPNSDIQIQKSMDIFLSESICDGVDNKIYNQFEYITNLYFEKLCTFKYSKGKSASVKKSEELKRVERVEKKIKRILERQAKYINSKNNEILLLKKSIENDLKVVKSEQDALKINIENEYDRIMWNNHEESINK